ncbi:MAG: tetratricopeptide repeat protein [Vulcanimicrobiaceae bacterium]
MRVGGLLLGAFTSAAEPIRTTPTEFVMRLNYAIRLRECAQFDVALDLLRTLATEVTNAPDLIRALSEIVSTLCAAGRIAQAREALDTMWRVHSDDSVCRPDAALMLAEMELAKAQVAWESGDANEAMAANKRSLTLLQTLDEPFFDRGVEIKALDLMGALYRVIGDPEASLAACGRFREMLARMPDPPATLRARLHLNFASTYMLMTGGLSLATAELSQALECARRYNLPNEAAEAFALFSSTALFRGDLDSATSYGRSALALGRSFWSAQTFATNAANLSRVEAMTGRSSLALSLLKESRLRLEKNCMQRMLTDLNEVELLLNVGESHRAAALATKTVLKLDRFGMARYLGSALYLEARAYVAIGRKRKAVQSIDASIGILERRGHPFSLALAYELSAKITVNARHRTEAEEIFATLRA